MWWQLGRWDTVDDMLRALDGCDLVRARAAYETVPLDDGWQQTDTVSRAINFEFERYTQAKAGRTTLDRSRLQKAGAYIPRVKPKKKVIVNNASIDYYHLMIQRQYGYG